MVAGRGGDVTIRLGIAGLGAIGAKVAAAIDAGRVPGIVLSAVSARDRVKAAGRMAEFRVVPDIVPIAQLADVADVVVECIPAAQFRAVAEPVLRAGKTLMPLSVGALLDHEDLIEIAAANGGRIVVPSGAILGLDALRAVAEGEVESVHIVTRKPPAGLVGAPLLIERGQSIAGLTKPVLLFSGTAREAAKGFPANVNVSVAVALAGIGPDRTRIDVWADPGVTRNTHTVTVKSGSSDLTMTIENIPSVENPRTGTITPLSVIAALRRMTAPLVAGT
jgi:aspartate dehydrogenase